MYELQKELCIQQENQLRVEVKDGEKVLWQTFTKLFMTTVGVQNSPDTFKITTRIGKSGPFRK